LLLQSKNATVKGSYEKSSLMQKKFLYQHVTSQEKTAEERKDLGLQLKTQFHTTAVKVDREVAGNNIPSTVDDWSHLVFVTATLAFIASNSCGRDLKR
jgi:hypothetical protein